VTRQITYFSLGSNLGDRQKNLEKARLSIIRRIGRHAVTSAIYESVPWGYNSDHLYLNLCTGVETGLGPMAILDEVLAIEKGLGRQREARGYIDRTIDIDILFCGNRIIRDHHLTVPHPAMEKRRFVLAPLNDIVPDLVHPISGLTVSEMLIRCRDESVVRRL